LHMNQSEYAPIWPYIIFAYNNASDFYVAAFTPMGGGNPEGIWLMHWNGTNMTNLNGTPIIDPYIEGENLFNQDADYPLGDYKLPEGAFYKLIYNSKSGYIDFKCWWDSAAVAMSEPAGWCMSDGNATLQHPDDPMGYGIGVWNPYDVDAQVQWDFINLWQINRTVNTSATITIDECDPAPRPHMNFPVLNMSNYVAYKEYLDSTYDGSIDEDSVRDIMKMVTNNFSMESRKLSTLNLEAADQNDTVYYYSCVYDELRNYTEQTTDEPAPDWMYDEYLHLHIQQCMDGELDDPGTGTFWDDAIIAIDVDGPRKVSLLTAFLKPWGLSGEIS
ncbi:MAG: hypothetical protein R6U98_19560, partial [Pirellulaceae bacterium]